MAIDHIARIVNMFSKKELETLKGVLNVSTEEGQDEIQIVIQRLKDGAEQQRNSLIDNYKFIFKPSSSHIYTYSNFNLDTISEITFDDWQIKEIQQVSDKFYLLVEKDSSAKRINAGWTYMNIDVKQVGIVVIHSDLNILEIRSNIGVQKQLERKLNSSFTNLVALSIDRSYYTAILEELNAKEFSVVWGTEGSNVKKAQLEGENVSVKNGAVIHVKDENGDIIAVDLGTEGTPESVWSTLQDTDTKVLLSSRGNLRVSKLVSEHEMNNIILKIVSALKGLPITQNTSLNLEDEATIEGVFYEFCSGTKKDVLNRFSKRYLAFRCLLSDDDAEQMLQYLQRAGYIIRDYEIICENDHHVATLEDISNQIATLECTLCSALDLGYDSNNYTNKKIYRVTRVGYKVLVDNEIPLLEEGYDSQSRGMNNPKFNVDPIDPVEFLEKEDEVIEIKRQLLEEALEINNKDMINKIVEELKLFKSPKAREVINISIIRI